MALVTVTGIASCAQPVAASELRSDKQRQTAPAASQSDLAALSNGNTAFALALYQALKGNTGNLFYSPYSISLALAMTYAGARGSTEKAMTDTLRFALSQDKLPPAFNSLDLLLKQRGQGAKGKDGEGFRLNIANAIWGQKDFKFLPGFLDTLAENYGSGLRVVDFVKALEQSRTQINDWVSEQTEGKIKDLVPPGAIDAATRLVLTNAIYFNAAWKYPFDEKVTASGVFNLLDGKQINVPMMKQTESFGYTEGNGYQAVELPYDGSQLSMVILLPSLGQFSAFENSLDAATVKAIVDKLQNRQVVLTMPRFEFDSTFSLQKTLSDMGMANAFTDGADFSGMTGKRDLYIDDVLHKAFVSVDEAGTEAAAATAVIMKLTSMPLEQTRVNIDRPFIFLIRDIATGTVLFAGRVVNPS